MPVFAEIDFIDPIEADFRGLNTSREKALYTLIYQCINDILRWSYVVFRARRCSPCGTQATAGDDPALKRRAMVIPSRWDGAAIIPRFHRNG